MYNNRTHSGKSGYKTNTKPPAKVQPGFVDRENYVADAESIIRSLESKRNLPSKTQLRKLSSMLAAIYNDVIHLHDSALPDRIKDQLRYFCVQAHYQGAREKTLKSFLDESHLINYTEYVITHGGQKDFVLLNHYMEALIAFNTKK